MEEQLSQGLCQHMWEHFGSGGLTLGCPIHPSPLQMLISNPKQCFPPVFVICDGIY